MSSIDKLKALLNKKTEQEIDDEEAYLIHIGKIPKQRTIDRETYDKLQEGFKHQFFNPHKTYDEDSKYKSIDKLKALLRKETNSGEKSHIEDKERKEKESTTPDNYYPNFRKFDIDDRDPEDKEIF